MGTCVREARALEEVGRHHEWPGILAAMLLGAAGAQLGSAFLACPESAASPAYRAALARAEATSTTLPWLLLQGHPRGRAQGENLESSR